MSSRAVSNYFQEVSRTIGRFSYITVPDPTRKEGYSLEWPSSNYCTTPLEESREFSETAKEIFGRLIRRTNVEKKQLPFDDPDVDTVLYPVVQFAPLLGPKASTHHQALDVIMSALSEKIFAGARWTFSTAYFNPTSALRSALISTTASQGRIVIPAPEATGFYGTAGIAGKIPSAFTAGACRFLKKVERSNRDEQVHLMEWRRGRGDLPGGWTYHAKGMWVTTLGERDPCMTIVGSSNYGERSFALDLEQDTIIVTKNAGLKQRMGNEERRIMQYTKRVTGTELSTMERKPPWLVIVLLWFIKLIGASI